VTCSIPSFWTAKVRVRSLPSLSGSRVHKTLKWEELAVTECDFYVFWFTDLTGRWQQHRFSSDAVDDAKFEHGFYASSMMTGWRQFGESDLLFKPCRNTEFKDAAEDSRARSFISEVWDEQGVGPYGRDPRGILAKTMAAAAADGWQFQVGPEIEGYLFDEVRWGLRANDCFYSISEPEGVENAREPSNPENRGFVLTHPFHHLAPTTDYGLKIRSQMVEMMIRSGMRPLHCLHEAGPSQFEIGIMHDDPLKAGDSVQLFKRLARACGAKAGKIATFMPMPLAFGPGSGMHINLSMWEGTKNAFYADGSVSKLCMNAIAGIMKHARSLAAFLAPTSNSYLRLSHLYRNDLEVTYGFGNRSAHIRIPQVVDPAEARIEIRFGDPSANIYLAIAAVMLAALDGVENDLSPQADELKGPVAYGPRDIRLSKPNSLPRTLEDAILALDTDKEFLQRYGAFSAETIEMHQQILIRRANAQSLYPNPRDFLEVLDC